jgi:transposase
LWLSGEIEVDESYFGGTWKWKRGCGPSGKFAVLVLLKSGRKSHVIFVPNAQQTGCSTKIYRSDNSLDDLI